MCWMWTFAPPAWRWPIVSARSLSGPGRILATEAVRDLAPDEAWQRRRRRASLKGVDGRLRLFSLDAQDGG